MKKELTIPEIIRHLNHDFLNKLNLIQMNIDLGKIDDCKKIIREEAEQRKIISNIHQLKCPKLITWIETFSFYYSAINFHVKSDVKKPLPIQLDNKIKEYLDQSILHIYNRLDPFIEQSLTLSVMSDDSKFEILFDLKGNWNAPKFNTYNDGVNFIVETYEQTNECWKYVIKSK